MFSSARSAAEKRSRVFASGAAPVLRCELRYCALRLPPAIRSPPHTPCYWEVKIYAIYAIYATYATYAICHPLTRKFEVAQPDALFVGFLGILGISNSYLGKCEPHRQGARCQEQRVWENRDLRLLSLASF